MLSKEKNQILCSVGAGTPVGELFRSLWLPALRSSQLPEPNCPPVRLKLLGEELVAFRDGTGGVGIVQANCAHRLAPLFFGKVEERGIRCAYHGWLFNSKGQCLDIPSDPAGTVCKNMKLKAYVATEKSDVIWIYMGADTPPELPKFPWMDLPKSQRIASVWLQETNWFQGVEGEIDSSHVSILHKSPGQKDAATLVHRPYTFSDPSPKLFTQDTPVGFMSIARRKAEEKFYWRITQWMAPMFSFVPSAVWPVSGRAWVPIDDENTYTWDFSFSTDKDIPAAFYESIEQGKMFPPEIEYKPYRLNTGAIIDTYIPKRVLANNYLIDRVAQSRSDETTGIRGLNDQDRSMQEGMGRISDRTQESLVGADLTVVTARRKILELVNSGESIKAFRSLVADGSAYTTMPVDTIETTDDLKTFLSGRNLL
ncbi:MAG: putative 3-chlorobenzoate-3,4-dioxygenase oxygenase [Rhizobacter sp.]|nr:putative 3-chlorobenzoate-3,4-dioxygenase oxygenase [Rhizobacter sp.]